MSGKKHSKDISNVGYMRMYFLSMKKNVFVIIIYVMVYIIYNKYI